MTVARWYLLYIIAAFLPYLVDTFSIKNARQPWCYLIYDQVFDVKTNSTIKTSVDLKCFQVQLKQKNFLTLKWWQVLDTKTKETAKKFPSLTTQEKFLHSWRWNGVDVNRMHLTIILSAPSQIFKTIDQFDFIRLKYTKDYMGLNELLKIENMLYIGALWV